ncbi:MAG: ABC transporter ATP-binding protein, partial [Hominisplanchenecus sp.]
KPDILIVDEVLAVGDFLFRRKCNKRMEEMLSGGTTLLFVSHNIEQVRNLCDHALWLNKGEAVMSGPVQEVCDAYQNMENSTE